MSFIIGSRASFTSSTDDVRVAPDPAMDELYLSPDQENGSLYLRKTGLDAFDISKTGKKQYKIVGEILLNREGKETYRCEYSNSKLDKFCNWIRHKLFNELTDRDILKYDNAVSIVDQIRKDVIAIKPDYTDEQINEITSKIVSKATNNKIMVRTGWFDANILTGTRGWIEEIPFKKDEQLPIHYGTKNPHAFNSTDLARANEMLHFLSMFGEDAINDL